MDGGLQHHRRIQFMNDNDAFVGVIIILLFIIIIWGPHILVPIDTVVGNKFASKWPGALDLDAKQSQAKITAKNHGHGMFWTKTY